MTNISYEDFAKLDLRVAKIIETEPYDWQIKTRQKLKTGK